MIVVVVYLLLFILFILFRDCREEEEVEFWVWFNFYEDDILLVVMYFIGLVVIFVYDGVVKVWNIDIGYVNCKLNVCDYGLEFIEFVILVDIKRKVLVSNVG